ncbi:hypothetical protein DSN97_02705 [Deferribacteraceae bacterium V6Fe1]|jgi:hypothetical protein|uniref:hypothetical protein n=1 Tax=Deferrivibrio essentukiensis TaxID=2880922 RepID=UPI001F61290E|nr:hypothetical protein [Deferrivibrio essentukiensis]MCB4203365.1 hypothetical protein [Deferrivibrio essentukiensis]UOD35269.1 hypothetical protein DSN97_02705 [Deferribacteraceae bacterium V6Fe1]
MNKTYLLILSFIIAGLFSGCSTHSIKIDTDKIVLFLKNKSEPTFHYSLDGYTPHKMSKTSFGYYYEVKKASQFKYFFTDETGLIKADCPLIEYDDFGGYNCIFDM